MESYLPISFLNDFIFCPRSIYFHQCYGKVSPRLYHCPDQTEGLAAHKTIDSKSYTTAASVLQNYEVYSHTYNIAGKIDTFDVHKGILSERKKKIKIIYDGYVFQLYAQYFALTDMGYCVKKIKLYSLDDNKSYWQPLPSENEEMFGKFESLLVTMRQFRLDDDFTPNPSKCQRCIYRNLCDKAQC